MKTWILLLVFNRFWIGTLQDNNRREYKTLILLWEYDSFHVFTILAKKNSKIENVDLTMGFLLFLDRYPASQK